MMIDRKEIEEFASSPLWGDTLWIKATRWEKLRWRLSMWLFKVDDRIAVIAERVQP